MDGVPTLFAGFGLLEASNNNNSNNSSSSGEFLF